MRPTALHATVAAVLGLAVYFADGVTFAADAINSVKDYQSIKVLANEQREANALMQQQIQQQQNQQAQFNQQVQQQLQNQQTILQILIQGVAGE